MATWALIMAIALGAMQLPTWLGRAPTFMWLFAGALPIAVVVVGLYVWWCRRGRKRFPLPAHKAAEETGWLRNRWAIEIGPVRDRWRGDGNL